MFQQRGGLEYIGERFTEARILDLIPENLSDEYEPIRFAAERDSEISLKLVETTMCNLYANHVARGGGSTFLHGKGRESAMTESSGLRGSCGYCNNPSYKNVKSFKFLRESGGESLSSSGVTRNIWCTFHNTNLPDNADCCVQ